MNYLLEKCHIKDNSAHFQYCDYDKIYEIIDKDESLDDNLYKKTIKKHIS